MKTYMKIALISLSIAGAPLLANEQEAIKIVGLLKNTVSIFEQAITRMCVQGDKAGSMALLALEKQLQETPLIECKDKVGQTATEIYSKFSQVVIKVCSILKSNKPLNEITLDLANNFDTKKLFTDVINDLNKLLSLAQQNNYPELGTLLEDLIKQTQTEQKKWSNPPATALVKFIQSIKAYFKR